MREKNNGASERQLPKLGAAEAKTEPRRLMVRISGYRQHSPSRFRTEHPQLKGKNAKLRYRILIDLMPDSSATAAAIKLAPFLKERMKT